MVDLRSNIFQFRQLLKGEIDDAGTNDSQIEERILDKCLRQNVMQMLLDMIQAQMYNITPYLEQENI
jgi:hypothetical protein